MILKVKERGIKLKTYYASLVVAPLFAQFCDSSVFAADITTRQVISAGDTQTVNGDNYTGITNPLLDGGAIYNAGTLTLNSATFSGNFGKNGGAIYNAGTIEINGGVFSGNSAYLNGGAIYSGGTLSVNSTATDAVRFDDNTAAGGVANDIYMLGAGSGNNAILNLNAYDADTHKVQLNGGVAGNFYNVNVNATGTGEVVVGSLTGANTLTVNAGTFSATGAVTVGNLNIIGSDTSVVVDGTLTAATGGSNAGSIDGDGALVIGNGVTAAVYENAGMIYKPVTVKTNATLSTDAYLLRADVVNNGVLQLNDTVLSRAVTGSGTTRINGIVASSASIANSIEILSGKSLMVGAGDFLGGVVTNAGTLTINGGNLTHNIVGVTGQTYIDGDVIAGTTVVVQNSVVINSGKSLQINAYGIHGNVNNAGTLVLNDGVLVKKILGAGETRIAGIVTLDNTVENSMVLNDGTELTTIADNIVGDVSNVAGTIYLAGGELAASISGAGATHIAGVVSVADGETIANALTIDGSNRLTASADTFGNTVSNAAGVLKLNGGTLTHDITGAGSTRAIADTVINARIANNLYLDGASEVTFVEDAAIASGGKVIANGGALSFVNNAIESFELQQINLQQDMNLALDLNLTNLTADVFNADQDSQSAADKWIVISKLNLINNVTSTIDDNTRLHIVNGTIGGNIKLADDIEFVNPGNIESVLVSYNYDVVNGGDLGLSYATMADAVVSSVAANKTIVLNSDATVPTSATGTSLVGDSLTVSGANHSITGDGGVGVSVATGQSLTMTNVSEIAGFTNAIVNNGGTVSLSNVSFALGETVDVVNNAGSLNLTDVQINSIANDALLNMAGSVTLNNDITGTGDLLVASGAVLSLGHNTITQDTITVNGTLQTSATDAGRLIATNIGGLGTLQLLDLRSAGLYDLFDGVSTLTIDAGALFTATNTAGGVLVEIKPAQDIAAAYNISADASRMIVNLANTSSDSLQSLGVRMRDELVAGNTGLVERVSDALNPETGAVVQSVSNVARDTAFAVANSRMVQNYSADARKKSTDVWTQGLLAHTKQSGMFSGNVHGVAAGVDMTHRGNKLVGVGYSFAHSDILSNSRDIDVDTSTLFLYGQYQFANWYTNAMLNYTVSDFTEDAGLYGIDITSNYDAKSYGVQFRTGYDFADGITPEFGLQYMHTDIDAFANSVGVKNHFSGADYMTMIFDTKYAREFKVAKKVLLRPVVHYALKYDLVSSAPDVSVSMPGVQSSAWNAGRLTRAAGELGLGISAKYRRMDASLNYDLEIRDGYTAHYGRARFKYNF